MPLLIVCYDIIYFITQSIKHRHPQNFLHLFITLILMLTHLYICHIYVIYRYFLESDDRLAEIGALYASGGMLTGEVKKELITLLTVRVI